MPSSAHISLVGRYPFFSPRPTYPITSAVQTSPFPLSTDPLSVFIPLFTNRDEDFWKCGPKEVDPPSPLCASMFSYAIPWVLFSWVIFFGALNPPLLFPPRTSAPLAFVVGSPASRSHFPSRKRLLSVLDSFFIVPFWGDDHTGVSLKGGPKSSLFPAIFPWPYLFSFSPMLLTFFS